MHACPDCGARCFCDKTKVKDEREARYCTHCLIPIDRAKMEVEPEDKDGDGSGPDWEEFDPNYSEE